MSTSWNPSINDPLVEICESFPVTNQEFKLLMKQFDKLSKHASWQFIKKNSQNITISDWDDINQEWLWAMSKAGSYYKRQNYIENSLKVLNNYIKGKFFKLIFKELNNLWDNKTKHGASRQKFGKYQEEILNKLVNNFVPEQERPRKDAPLTIDSKFIIYAKAITWNHLKTIGKKITKERSIRAGQVSINENEFLCDV